MGKKKAAGTRGAFAECPGGSSGVIHGAAGQHPGGLWLGQVSHSEIIREISLSLDSRRTRGHVACSEGSRRWFTVQALGDRWQVRAVSGRGGFSLGTREHVACSEDVSKKASGETLGKASGT